MPIITNLEDKILQLVRSNQYQWFTVGINLGGVPGEGGGSGTPIGGFTGQLIQSRVTYDTTEAESLTVPSSGQSLVHNLNRIRYWLNQRGLPLVIQDDGVEVASGVTTLDFVGAPVDVTFSSGKAIVTISGTGGGGGGDTVKVSSDDTVTNYLDNKITVALPITKVVNNPGGNENIEVGFNGALDDLSDVSIVTAVSGQVLAYTNEWLSLSLVAAGISAVGHTHVEGDITNLDHNAVKLQGDDISTAAPASGQALVYNSIEYAPGTVGADIDVEEDDTPTVSSATVLNFEGAVDVIDDGGGKATVVVSSGTALDSFEAKVSSNDTTENFLENKIVAGTNVTIAVQDEGANETLEISASGGGGSDLEVKDEGSTLTSTGTSLDFVGPSVVATNVGDDVTVTISGAIVDVPTFRGTRLWSTGVASPTTGSWTSLDWGAGNGEESYDTDGWFPGTDDTTIQVDTAGYYYIYGQISWEKSSTAGYLQTGIWKDSGAVLIVDNIHGYANDYDSPATTGAGTVYYLDADDTVYMRHFISESGTFPIASGIGQTYLEVHEVQPILINSLARVYRSSNKSITSSSDTPIDFNTEQYDTDSFWTSGSSTRITIPSDGYYHIDSTVAWEQNNTGYRRHWLRLDGGSTVIAEHQTIPAASSDSGSYISTDYYFTAGQYIEVYVWHNKGTASNVLGNLGRLYIDIHKIGS
jgi:hypothetical protein